jgi:hypothetical protein
VTEKLWRLELVRDVSWDDATEVWFQLVRHQPENRHRVLVRLRDNGKHSVMQNFRELSNLRVGKRRRAIEQAELAIAFWRLTGNVEGYPEVELW